MANVSGVRVSRLFVILNPGAGSYSAQRVREALKRHLNGADGSFEVHEATEHENLTELARAAAERGWAIVAAGGGDGTVSGVANGLVGTSAALGIIPLGTCNILAQELGIPFEVEDACTLLIGPHAVANVDTIEVKGRHYLTQVGIGIDALMIRDATRDAKRRLGRIAYPFAALKRLIGFQPRRFRISVDGRPIHRHASQVALANCGTMGWQPLRWGPDIRPNDGRINVCIIRARNLVDYLVLAWHVCLGRRPHRRHMTYLIAHRTIAVATDKPMTVQGDGETMGETPIEAQVKPGHIRVVVSEQGIPPAPN